MISIISELKGPRHSHSCALLTQFNSVTGVKELVVVVAGGENEDVTLSSTEVLKIGSSSGWLEGPNLTVPTSMATMVEYKGSVILIGGNKKENLFQLSSIKDGWKMMPQALATPRSEHVSFLIPDEIANCS